MEPAQPPAELPVTTPATTEQTPAVEEKFDMPENKMASLITDNISEVLKNFSSSDPEQMARSSKQVSEYVTALAKKNQETDRELAAANKKLAEMAAENQRRETTSRVGNLLRNQQLFISDEKIRETLEESKWDSLAAVSKLMVAKVETPNKRRRTLEQDEQQPRENVLVQASAGKGGQRGPGDSTSFGFDQNTAKTICEAMVAQYKRVV